MADEETIAELEAKARPKLERLARKRRGRGAPNTITYEKLASEVGPLSGVPDLGPHDRRLHLALGNLAVASYRKDGILLSVLVVNKQTGMPGGGFFWLAKKGLAQMGFENPYPEDPLDYEVFHDACDRVHERYGG